MMTFHSLRRTALILAVCLVCTPPVLAQETSADEAVLYQTWYAANSQNMKEKAIESAAAYLAQFPSGQYSAYLKTWLNAHKLQAFGEAVQAKNTADMIKVGREILAADPENLAVRYSLAYNLRRLELAASPASFAHAQESVEFAAAAIKAIEAGKTIEGGTFNKEASLALLYQVQALVAANAKQNDQAISLYAKSNAADPGNVGIVAYNLLALASLHRVPYDQAARAYQALPEADRQAAEPSAEVTAALEAVKKTAEPLIDDWARFVALARARGVAADTAEQVLASVQTVYSSSHGGDTSGLEPLIEKLKAEYAPKS